MSFTKALWIRVEAHEINSTNIAELAEALGIKPVTALGHYVALGGNVAEHTPDGHIANLSNGTIETWGHWDGKKGEFAKAVREILQDGHGFFVEWAATMGKLVERRTKDRKRKADGNQLTLETAPLPSPEGETFRGNSAELPRKVSGNSTESDPTFRGNSAATARNGTEPTTDDDTRARAVQDLATTLAMHANAVVTARWGEQTQPIRAAAGTSVEACEKLLNANVPLDFAKATIDRIIAKAKRIPRHLTFFADQIVEDFTKPLVNRGTRQPPQQFNYGNPTNSVEEVKWQD